ncbi:MAG: T9SS type A sorting domain-containing protein [Chloroflexota bacterium]
MRKVLPFLLSAILLLMIIPAQATVVVITQEDLTFSPSSTTVQVGDTVRWVWTSGSHTTTSTSVPAGAATWNSPLTSAVTQFEYIVTVEGTYNYVCTPHASLGMTGSFTATASLGFDNKSWVTSAKLYPNPARDNTVLKLNSEESGSGVITVYDLLGNQMNMSEVTIKSGSNNLQVPIENVLPGIYFVELKYNQAAIVRRFVKSR